MEWKSPGFLFDAVRTEALRKKREGGILSKSE